MADFKDINEASAVLIALANALDTPEAASVLGQSGVQSKAIVELKAQLEATRAAVQAKGDELNAARQTATTAALAQIDADVAPLQGELDTLVAQQEAIKAELAALAEAKPVIPAGGAVEESIVP